ncbi:MAG: hypothetical protein GX549_07855 [Clostridiales bacterium]|nr:hypothetical protein [Clostridiales bacterium]
MSEQNPDADVIEKKTDDFPCPSCGGNMHFDPESGNMRCQYCSNVVEFGKKDDEILEYDLFSAKAGEEDGDWGAKTISIKCQNCGAQTAVDKESIARFCAFCGSSHILKEQEVRGIAPESVIPFAITEKKARESFRVWIRKRFFAPNALKRENTAGSLAGAYVPYWTYDADTYYTFTAQAGDYYYVTQTRYVNGKRQTHQVRKIRWRLVNGSGQEYFDDVPILATRKMDGALVHRLEPFPFAQLVPYQPEYLSGFVAERYSVTLAEGWGAAKTEIRRRLESIVRRSVRADEVRNIHIVTNYKQVLYKHLLVPVWISSYQYRGKIYQYVVNGATGKVSGRAPVSALKITVAVLLGLAAVALAVWLYMRFSG